MIETTINSMNARIIPNSLATGKPVPIDDLLSWLWIWNNSGKFTFAVYDGNKINTHNADGDYRVIGMYREIYVVLSYHDSVNEAKRDLGSGEFIQAYSNREWSLMPAL